MQKKGVLFPMLVALGVSLVYFMWVSSKKSSIEKAYEKVNVLTAAADLPERTVLNENLFAIASIPRKFAQSDAVIVESKADFKTVTNTVTLVRIPKGNQITLSALTTLSPEAGLSVKIRPEFRGVILEVEKGMLPLIKPGDRIDILCTFEANIGEDRDWATVTLLQNVRVLGVGSDLGQGMNAQLAGQKKKADAEAEAFSTGGLISLAVNPSEAQYLALAQKQGKLTPILRAPGDVKMYPLQMSTFRSLIK